MTEEKTKAPRREPIDLVMNPEAAPPPAPAALYSLERVGNLPAIVFQRALVAKFWDEDIAKQVVDFLNAPLIREAARCGLWAVRTDGPDGPEIYDWTCDNPQQRRDMLTGFRMGQESFSKHGLNYVRTLWAFGTEEDARLFMLYALVDAFEPNDDKERRRYLNKYRCPRDGDEWEDQWSSACNDKCPTCDAEIEPYDSEDVLEDEITVLKLTPQGFLSVHTFDNGSSVETLQQVQKILGGDLQYLTVDLPNTALYCDNEGKLKGSDPNPFATLLCEGLGVGLSPDDVIHGNLLICGETPAGDLESVREDVQALIEKLVKATGGSKP